MDEGIKYYFQNHLSLFEIIHYMFIHYHTFCYDSLSDYGIYAMTIITAFDIFANTQERDFQSETIE